MPADTAHPHSASQTLTPPPPAFLSAVRDLLGPSGWSTDPDRIAPQVRDWRGRGQGHTPLLCLPASTDDASALITLCARHGVAVTPQGGNTGLVDGGLPHGEVLVSTSRLNRIRDIDVANASLVAEAGVVLTTVHEAASRASRFFPLALGSQGSATLGGLISTNAGGVAVLRYGMMRDLILGLEVVLPSGEVWNGLTGLRKDNTGYDLKHLFAGAEGTLGLITAASLKLFPQPARATAWAVIATPDAALTLLSSLREALGDTLTAFELIPDIGLRLVLEDIPGTRDPLPNALPWRLLIEVSMHTEAHAQEALEAALAQAMEAGTVADAVLAASLAQAQAFWTIRESIPLSKRAYGAVIAHDISVPVSRIPSFLSACETHLADLTPGSDIIAFGHVGDGNLHYSVCVPKTGDTARFLARRAEITGAVHDLVCRLGGSISAEHGVGREKRDEIARRKSPVEMRVMRALKAALDPQNLFNPGRVLDV